MNKRMKQHTESCTKEDLAIAFDNLPLKQVVLWLFVYELPMVLVSIERNPIHVL